MISIAICDDDPYYREKEQQIVNEYMTKKKLPARIFLYPDGEQILDAFSHGIHFDICFFDVSMKDVDGMQAALKMRSGGCNAQFAFITAYMTYALEGYKVDAARYIIKSPNTLNNDIIECLDIVIKRLNIRISRNEISDEERNLINLSRNAVYIESSLHKLIFHYSTSTEIAYGKLDNLEKILPEEKYCRIHQSYLINLANIKNIKRYSATLKNGTAINISKSRYNAVREQYFKYVGDI